MKTIKFKTLFSLNPKSNIKAGDGLVEGSFSFYTSSPILSKRIDKAQYDQVALVFGTGGCASVHYVDEPFATSTDCLVAVPLNDKINTKLVYYYLSGNIHYLEKGFKGSGLKHISRKYIENLNIPVISLDMQNKIVALLDEVNSLIKKRSKTIDLLQESLKATYQQMFGPNNSLYESWKSTEIQTLVMPKKGSMRTGPFGSSLKHEEFKDKGAVAVLGIDNAVDNVFRWKKKRFISLNKYRKYKQYTVYPRDVIVTIMGTVGRSAVIPPNIPKAINTKHLAAITLDENKCNPYYLAYSIHSNPFLLFQMRSQNRGAIMNGLNLGIIKKLYLKVPPIELQNRFEDIYLSSQSCLDKLVNSNDEIFNLFKSLTQKAFNGELIFNLDFELDRLLREVDLTKKENDLSNIVNDEVYLQKLIDKLNSQDFNENDLYDKAKHVLLQLLREGHKIVQEYNEKNKSIKLALK